MDRPYSLRELREGISHLGEWDLDARKVTVMVADASKTVPRGRRDEQATLPLRPIVFVHRGEELVFEGVCLVDLEALGGDGTGGDVAAYVAGWIERTAVGPDVTLAAQVVLEPQKAASDPLLANVSVRLTR